MLTYVGNIDEGNSGSGGSYAIKTTSNIQPLQSGQIIALQVVVEDASFFEDNFNVRCTTDSVPADPPVNEGVAASVVDLNQWESGYIVTFSCTLARGEDNMLIDFNYTGGSRQISSWMLTWIGSIERGFIADDGGFAMRNAPYVPDLCTGQ